MAEAFGKTPKDSW